MEVGGDNKNKEGKGCWRVKRGGQRYVLRCRWEKQGVLGHPIVGFPCRELFLQFVNIVFCNVHNVFITVVRVKQ